MADNQCPQVPTIAQGALDPPLPQKPQIPLVPQAPHVPQAPQVAQQLVLHMPPLKWSHFKPKFSGKPDEDAEAHLLMINNWMDTHRFQDNYKIQRFCLTLTWEARMWYKLFIPIHPECLGLQKHFRQQYSKISNTREQVFHAWRSFHFYEKHRNNRCLHALSKTSSYTIRLSRATNIRSFQKHTSYKTMLGSFPNNGHMKGSGNSKENLN